jgi:hypothetical protein
MICPLCGKENTDNWPVTVEGIVKEGGCQDCWEKQSDDAWRKTMEILGEIFDEEK